MHTTSFEKQKRVYYIDYKRSLQLKVCGTVFITLIVVFQTPKITFMKFKIFITLIFSIALALKGNAQDTTKMHTNVNKVQVNNLRNPTHRKAKNTKSTSKIYRDTRLGSSEPQYNTYKKNDNGAGAVTTSPKKK